MSAGWSGTEHLDAFADVDVFVTYGDESLIATLQADPLLSKMPAVASDAIVTLPSSDPLGTAANPTPLSNLLEIAALLLIPVCLTRTYGTLVGDRRQGLTLLAVMAAIWSLMLTLVWIVESRTAGSASAAAGAMMEGKEVRFGIPGSVLFAVSTTGTSTGAVNSAHDSFSAVGGGAVLLVARARNRASRED